MDRLLARLERKFGRYAIERLPTFIVAGMAIAYVLSVFRPEFLSALTLDLAKVRAGQVWRLVSFLFLPRETNIIWILFALLWIWMLGNHLEQEWGAFKLNVFYLLGMLGTILAAVITKQPVGNTHINTSILFAFATLYPNFEFYLIIIPLRIKYLAWITAAYLLYRFVGSSWGERGAMLAAYLNYFLFFGGVLWARIRGAKLVAEQASRRASLRPESGNSVLPDMGARSCAICGAKEADGVDIRVCSCEKCGGERRNLCLAHARNH